MHGCPVTTDLGRGVLLGVDDHRARAELPVGVLEDQGEALLLADLNLRGALMAAAFFLPKRLRRRLRVIGR